MKHLMKWIIVCVCRLQWVNDVIMCSDSSKRHLDSASVCLLFSSCSHCFISLSHINKFLRYNLHKMKRTYYTISPVIEFCIHNTWLAWARTLQRSLAQRQFSRVMKVKAFPVFLWCINMHKLQNFDTKNVIIIHSTHLYLSSVFTWGFC